VHGGTDVEVNVWGVINPIRWRENRGVINLEDLNLTEGETSCGEGRRSSQVASWQLATAAAAHGFAGASICGARTAQARGSTTRREVRLERGRGARRSAPKQRRIPFVATTRREGRSVLELAKMARDGGGGARLRRARRFAARARRGRIDETKKVRLEEGRSVRQRALKTREISPSRLRGRR
jgi:hypothetical protein